MRRVLSSACAVVVLAAAHDAAAYCPCYTASSSNNTHDCGVEAVSGTNPTVAEWQGIFDLVSQGPSVWGSAGPDVEDIGQGCGNPEALHSVPARFPCELLKAIAMAESAWKQFCIPDTPSDQVGPPERTIISFDCGYGVGQVTSGMHAGETPAFDRQRVASDATYNLATGTQILASKWRNTQCVGDNQPSIIEDWYTATWAYNGLAWSNNPNNPNHDPNRGVYDPAVGGSYPYQEKVFGRIEHTTGSEYWASVALAYPDRADCGSGGAPPELPEPSCASPTDCSSSRSVHVSSCFATNPPDAGTGGAGGSAGAGGMGGTGGSAGAPMDAAVEAGGADASAGSGGTANWPDAGAGGVAGTAGSSGGGYDRQPDDASGCACRTGRGDRGTGLAAVLAAVCAALVFAWRKKARRLG
jgi:hypothetical protein